MMETRDWTDRTLPMAVPLMKSRRGLKLTVPPFRSQWAQ